MTKGAPVYGLGEQVRGINTRGWIYTSDCTDEPNHREDTHTLYAAHNFLVFAEKEPFGIFLDNPGKLPLTLAIPSRILQKSLWTVGIWICTLLTEKI